MHTKNNFLPDTMRKSYVTQYALYSYFMSHRLV